MTDSCSKDTYSFRTTLLDISPSGYPCQPRIEYIIWIRMPISLMLFFVTQRSLKKVFIDHKPDSRSIFGSILTGVFFLLFLIGKTKAETARLWMFLLPVVCITSAGYLDYMNNNPRARQAMVFIVLLLEFGTTYFILRYQDFF